MAVFFATSLLVVSSVCAEKRSVVQIATLVDTQLHSKDSKDRATEDTIWRTFQALPKNEYGRLDADTAAVALQRHFSMARNWRVATDSDVVQGALNKVNHVGRGFTSRSLTEAISLVNEAITNEPRERLLGVFAASNVSCVGDTGCNLDELSVILTAYMKAFLLPSMSSPEEVAKELPRAFDAWRGFSGRNAFKPPTYPFIDVLAMVEQFEAELEGQSRDLCGMQSSSDSSCFASGRHYAVCCVSPCERIVAELETQIQAPVVSPDRLLRVVSKLSLPSVEANFHRPFKFQKQLDIIEARHGGDVPLHGHDVAEWLHLVFPNECPLPKNAMQDEEKAQAPRKWNISFQDLARIAVFVLIGVAMLRAAVAQWQTANGALKDTSREDSDLKKPQNPTTTTFV